MGNIRKIVALLPKIQDTFEWVNSAVDEETNQNLEKTGQTMPTSDVNQTPFKTTENGQDQSLLDVWPVNR